MESAALAVVVGVLVGGFSTWLAHLYDRLRRKELREEERRRDLRRMLEAMMQLARQQHATLIICQVAMHSGRDVERVIEGHFENVREIEKRYPDFFWRPARIKDEVLTERTKRLQAASSEASQLLQTTEATPEWTAAAARVMHRIKSSLEKVDERLAELDW